MSDHTLPGEIPRLQPRLWTQGMSDHTLPGEIPRLQPRLWTQGVKQSAN